MGDNKTVIELALEERKFLHEISNKLLIADGMSSKVLKLLQKEKANPDIIRRQEKAVKAIKEQIDLLKRRRFLLHERSN